jgi:peptidoglycan-associated lipoprotein
MMIRAWFVVLGIVAGLSGCASTPNTSESPDVTAATAAPSSGKPQSASPAPSGRRQPQATGGSESFAKRSVYYEFDMYDVKPEYRALVESHAAYLRQNPGARIVVEGNTDEHGSREYNVALGQRRAESVMKMMRLLGVKDGQIEAVSFGEEKPRAQGHDDASWAENRRSDFTLSKQ